MSVTPTISRRQLLYGSAAAPVVLLVGCSTASPDAADADDQLRQQVAVRETELIRQYDATIAKFPALATLLTGIRDQHQQHLMAMVSEPIATDLKAYEPPSSQSAAVKQLISAERTAANERQSSCEAANDADLIWELALICASESQHVIELAKVN